MDDNIVFENNSVQVMNIIKETAIAWLNEASGEIEAQTKDNYDAAGRVDTGETKGSFKHHVDDDELKATIGSEKENAIWEEYGTGIYAENGNGRQGGWYIHESQLTEKAKSRMKKVHGKNGEVFYFTKGKKGHRPFQHAYNSKQSTIIRMAEEKFGENLK